MISTVAICNWSLLISLLEAVTALYYIIILLACFQLCNEFEPRIPIIPNTLHPGLLVTLVMAYVHLLILATLD
jgi:hypothetical protein